MKMMSRYIILEHIHWDNPNIVTKFDGLRERAKFFSTKESAEEEAKEYNDSMVVKLY